MALHINPQVRRTPDIPTGGLCQIRTKIWKFRLEVTIHSGRRRPFWGLMVCSRRPDVLLPQVCMIDLHVRTSLCSSVGFAPGGNLVELVVRILFTTFYFFYC